MRSFCGFFAVFLRSSCGLFAVFLRAIAVHCGPLRSTLMSNYTGVATKHIAYFLLLESVWFHANCCLVLFSLGVIQGKMLKLNCGELVNERLVLYPKGSINEEKTCKRVKRTTF